MQVGIESALREAKGLESGLNALIQVKLKHFAVNRLVLRALLRNGADPAYPLSPFSAETKLIREIDLEWFRRVVTDSGIRVPRDLQAHLPVVLWFFQMGVIFFWVTDDSENQARTAKLLPLACKIVANQIPFPRRPSVALWQADRGAHRIPDWGACITLGSSPHSYRHWCTVRVLTSRLRTNQGGSLRLDGLSYPLFPPELASWSVLLAMDGRAAGIGR